MRGVRIRRWLVVPARLAAGRSPSMSSMSANFENDAAAVGATSESAFQQRFCRRRSKLWTETTSLNPETGFYVLPACLKRSPFKMAAAAPHEVSCWQIASKGAVARVRQRFRSLVAWIVKTSTVVSHHGMLVEVWVCDNGRATIAVGKLNAEKWYSGTEWLSSGAWFTPCGRSSKVALRLSFRRLQKLLAEADEEQRKMMEERVILTDYYDNEIGHGSKKESEFSVVVVGTATAPARHLDARLLCSDGASSSAPSSLATSAWDYYDGITRLVLHAASLLIAVW